MFSYGMVLYELLSGQRPVLGQHQLQISKKLSKGIRPALGQPEEVQFHRMQALMAECWDTKPEQVTGCLGAGRKRTAGFRGPSSSLISQYILNNCAPPSTFQEAEGGSLRASLM